MGTIRRDDTRIRAAATSTGAASQRVSQINTQLAGAVSPALRGDVPELAEIDALYRTLAAGLRSSAASLDSGARNLGAFASLAAMTERRNLALVTGVGAPRGPGHSVGAAVAQGGLTGGLVQFLQWTQVLPGGGSAYEVGTWLAGTSLTSVSSSVEYLTKVRYGHFAAAKFRAPWAKGYARWRIPLNQTYMDPFEKAFRHGFSSQYKAGRGGSVARQRLLGRGRLVGRAGGVLTAGMGFHEQWQDDSGKRLTTEAKVARAGTVAAASAGGAMVGAQAGASVGAMVGSFGGPIGTVAGAAVGGLVGGAAGSELGKRGGRAVAGAAGRAADQAGDWAGEARDATAGAARATGRAAHAAAGSVGEAADDAKDKAVEVASAAKDKAGDVADAAKDKAEGGAKAAGKAASKVAGWANPFG